MEERIVEFVRGLRMAGVRISLAESMDALQAIAVLGINEKRVFRESLRTTLIKESADFAVFEELFPLYFGSGGPPMQSALEDLSQSEREILKAALAEMSGRLQQLLDWLTGGDGPTKEELEELARRSGASWANSPGEARWVSRRLLRQLGYKHLEDQFGQLLDKLQEMGMSPEAIEKLLGIVEANKEALAEQVSQQVGLQSRQGSIR